MMITLLELKDPLFEKEYGYFQLNCPFNRIRIQVQKGIYPAVLTPLVLYKNVITQHFQLQNSTLIFRSLKLAV
jgi:hypothetical protein